jgi:hypothetical protein
VRFAAAADPTATLPSRTWSPCDDRAHGRPRARRRPPAGARRARRALETRAARRAGAGLTMAAAGRDGRRAPGRPVGGGRSRTRVVRRGERPRARAPRSNHSRPPPAEPAPRAPGPTPIPTAATVACLPTNVTRAIRVSAMAHPSRARDWENPTVTQRNRCDGGSQRVGVGGGPGADDTRPASRPGGRPASSPLQLPPARPAALVRRRDPSPVLLHGRPRFGRRAHAARVAQRRVELQTVWQAGGRACGRGGLRL